MRRALAAVMAATTLVGASYGLRGLTSDPAAKQIPAYRATPSPMLHEIDRLIAVFEERVGTVTDALNSRQLGRLHLERGQLTGDVAAFGSAIDALGDALELAPNHPTARLQLAQASLAVHRFEKALTIGADLIAADPANAAAILVAADASFALGNTEAAAAAVDSVESILGAIPPVLIRRAQHADARGDVAGALDFAEAALDAARTAEADPHRMAFHLTFVAHFLNDLGHYERAEATLRRAIGLDEDWPAAYATLGAVLVSQGRLSEAVEAYGTAAEISQDPGTLGMIGDLHTALGNNPQADGWYRRVEPAANKTSIHEEAYRRTLATYLADHDLDPDRALALAVQDVAGRNDPFGQDIYAWALYRAGRIAEARTEIDVVFSVGLREPQMLYHSSLIANAEGDTARAVAELREALDLAPRFHPLQAPHARRLLLELGG